MRHRLRNRMFMRLNRLLPSACRQVKLGVTHA